jgi:ABC-type multidrug transport system permease subunit
MMMVAVTPNLTMGISFGVTVLGAWFIFAGLIIPRPSMPDWWRWLYYLMPPSWSVYAVVADQLGDKARALPHG